jgi:superoxide reductase
MLSGKEFSLTKLNKPENWKNLADMAKKHVPIITVPSKVKENETFTVDIKVGGLDGVNHPNTLGHWINWIELYAGDLLITRVEFAPTMCDNYVLKLDVSLDETNILRSRAFCNLHGVWEGKEKKVIVE